MAQNELDEDTMNLILAEEAQFEAHEAALALRADLEEDELDLDDLDDEDEDDSDDWSEWDDAEWRRDRQAAYDDEWGDMMDMPSYEY